jgi:hypothetical protein
MYYLGAIEVAVLRTVCKTVHNNIDEEDEKYFAFKFAPIIHLLAKFTRAEHLLWVVRRLGEKEHLVQPPFNVSDGRVPGTDTWRHLGLRGSILPHMRARHRQLERLVRAFWFHPSVRALLATAIRLDSSTIIRYLSVEAPSSDCPDHTSSVCPDNTNQLGPHNFLYNCWVHIEESQMNIALWKPLHMDPLFPAGEHYFSKLHFFLCTFMEQIRGAHEIDFQGYFPECEYSMTHSTTS